MNTLRFQHANDLRFLAPEWDDLADRAGAGPFERPGWIEAWWHAFGKGRLHLLTVRDPKDGVLRAVLPLQHRRGALSSPTNWHTPRFALVAEDAEAARVLLASVLGDGPRRVALAFLEESQADLVQAAAAARGYRVIRRVLQHSPYVPVQGGWSEYEQLLGRKVRSELGRRHRLLCRRGHVVFEVNTGERRLEELLEEGFGVEGSGWKVERGTAICSRPETRRFYSDVARWAAIRGWLRLAFLRLDGRPVAFNLCLEHLGVHYLLKSGYDPAFRDLGPGKLLRHHMLARAFREGLTSYEFLGDASPSKLECTVMTRPRHLVQGFCPSPLGTLDWSAFAYGRPLVKRARDLARRMPESWR